MGCSVTGTKPAAGPSPLKLGPKAEVSQKANTNPFSFLLRLLLGTAAGSYYFILPIYMVRGPGRGGAQLWCREQRPAAQLLTATLLPLQWLKDKIWPKNAPGF